LQAGVAGAAVQAFTLSPTSGPPGTTVHVSGTGCSPGLVLSPAQDFVQVGSATVPPTSSRFAVAANGSWSGTFAVPANATAAPAAVSALCVSDGLQSLLTIYLPQTFTVTAAPAPTTVPTTTPTTSPTTTPTTGSTSPSTGTGPPTSRPTNTTVHSGPTTPGTGPHSGPPTTTPAGSTVSTPGDGTGAVIGGGGDTTGSGRPSSSGGAGKPSATGTGKTASPGITGTAADLSTPSLSDVTEKNSGAFGWLAWILIIAALSALLGFLGWLYWTRYRRVAPDAQTDIG
jgi:hypothetical protein